jgi:hypothetical protein
MPTIGIPQRNGTEALSQTNCGSGEPEGGYVAYNVSLSDGINFSVDFLFMDYYDCVKLINNKYDKY